MIVCKNLANNIMFVESLGPTLRNLVLDLVFDKLLVWRLSKSSLHRLFVELIKLVVEAGNHILDLRTFLFGLKALDNCLLDFLSSGLWKITRKNSIHVLLPENVINSSIFI